MMNAITFRHCTVLCKNLIVDAICRYYEALCKQAGILFTCNTVLPCELLISVVELTIIFGNLLENAYEAAKMPGCDKPFASVQATLGEDNSFRVFVQFSTIK